MLRIHLLLTALLLLGMAAGCKAQPIPPSDAPAHDLALNRRIEVMVRSQFNLPGNLDVSFGARQPSQIPGYEKLPVTITQNARKTVVDFLISTDNKTLARLETMDLEKDPAFSIDVAGRPIRGNPSAKVTIINFDDLECPYCARMHQTLFPGVEERYKDKVRFIYKDDPLLEIHPWALRAAVDANCLAAESSEVYWNYLDYIHGHGQEINGQNRDASKSFAALDRIARAQATVAKLDLARLDACLAKQNDSQVRASMKEAETLRIEGTPVLFVNGERVDGAQPEAVVWAVIDRALRAAGVEPPAAAAPAAGTN